MFKEVSYTQKSTEMELKGYNLYFFRRKKKGYILLKKQINYQLTNLQSIFRTTFRRKNENMYCEYDYLNQETKMKVNFDFENNTFKVKINNSDCINLDIDRNIFYEEKVGITFTGYSTKLAPVKIELNNLQVEKYAFPIIEEEIFHANVNNFVTAYNQFGEKYKLESSNIANVLLSNSKIKNTILNTHNLLDMMAKRSDDLEKIFENEKNMKKNNKDNNDEDHLFFDNPAMFKKMENHMSTVQSMVDYNQNLEKNFSDLENNFGGIQKLFDLESRLENLDRLADGLNEMINIYENEKLLKNLESFSGYVDSDKFIRNKKIVEKIRQKVIEALEVSNTLKIIAGIIFFLVFFLMICIIRKINQSIKTQVF